MSSNDPFPTCAIRRTVEWRLFLADRWCAGVTAVAAVVSSWLDRSRSRRALAAFDDHQLRDIGLSRGEAWRESSKCFWRP
jgi:uncharacterized protein YjiS (DUF1127 family)